MRGSLLNWWQIQRLESGPYNKLKSPSVRLVVCLLELSRNESPIPALSMSKDDNSILGKVSQGGILPVGIGARWFDPSLVFCFGDVGGDMRLSSVSIEETPLF